MTSISPICAAETEVAKKENKRTTSEVVESNDHHSSLGD
jgi:hypothetical protein